MSNDESATPTVDDNGRRYYDLYIRATVKKEGATTVKYDTDHMIAYYMYNYLTAAANNEKSLLGNSYSASSSNFTLRFNYVSAIAEETNTLTWQNDVLDVPIAFFIPAI